MTITPEKIAELRRLINNATPGTWGIDPAFGDVYIDPDEDIAAFAKDEDKWLCVYAINHLSALLDALEAERARNVWQPISTAPKTGERLLLAADWTDKLKCKQVAYGHWYKLGPYWAYDGYQFGNPECQPTHWMPLPTPPEKELCDE